MIKSQAGQIINAQIKDTSGNPFTGACVVYIDGDNTGQVLGQTGAGACANKGNGEYSYVVAAGDVAYNHIAFTFVPTGGFNVTIQVDTLTPSQISALQTASGLASVNIADLLVDAAVEIRVARWGGTLEPGVAAGLLRKLNRILDKWNADPAAKFSVGFQSFTPTPNHGPHTLGPNSADWSTTARPDRILGANLILNTVTPAVRVPINVRSKEWWLRETVQRLATSIVTDLYYEPDWPNGAVNLWPIPTSTYPIELLTDSTFAAYGPNDVLWLPFGYADALTYTLAEESASALGQEPTAQLHADAANARVIVFGNNVETRDVRTRDGGMPGTARGRRYLYLTGRTK